MSATTQRACVWTGPVMLGLFFVGVLACGWIPPPSPHQTAGQVARMYHDHATGIRIGSLLIGLGGGLFGLFTAVVAVQVKRIEGVRAPLAYATLGFGFMGGAFLTLPTFFFEAAAFRPTRNPQITQGLHDLGWIPLVVAVVPFFLMNIAVGLAILSDRRSQPVFPRWLGYLSLWMAVLLLPSGLILFFKTGPFAWNGIFTFWMAAIAFSVWLIAMTVTLFSAIAADVGPALTPGDSALPRIAPQPG